MHFYIFVYLQKNLHILMQIIINHNVRKKTTSQKLTCLAYLTPLNHIKNDITKSKLISNRIGIITFL